MGAATCLILAGTFVLSLASGYIAFNGWPGVRVVDGGEQQALVAQARAEADTGAAGLVSLRVPISRAASASPRGGRRVGDAASTRRPASAPTGAPSASTEPAPGGASLGTAPAPSAPTAAPEPEPSTTPQTGDPVRDVGKTLDETVDSVGQALGDIVTPTATPGVGGAVQNTTDVVGDVVDRLTGVVGTVVDNLGTKPTG